MCGSKRNCLVLTVRTFKEGEAVVAYVPELDLSSCGDTVESARRNAKDAVQGFIEVCRETGSLREILLESSSRRHESISIVPK